MTDTIHLQARLIDAAAKRVLADTVIKNGKIVDVFSGEITEGDVAIAGGVIVGIGEYEGKETVDATGKWICPGFIDGHVHIESAMVPPGEFASVVVPHGVTTVIADPHEIANVCGAEGIRYMYASSEGLPLDVFIMLPSCVPAAPFELAGARLEAEDLAPLYEYPRVLGLGEVMNAPAVINGEAAMLAKLAAAADRGRLIDGHAAGLDPDALNVYRTAGIRNDHECTTAEEALARLRRGMYVMVREGSAARNLEAVIPAVRPRNARRFLFVTDDKHLDDLVREGSIDYNIRLAIRCGLDPVVAIQMATLNAAECFRLENKGGIAPGYAADLVLLDDLETVAVSRVYKAGQLVASGGQLARSERLADSPPSGLTRTVHIKPLAASDLDIRIGNASGIANIIGVIPNSIETRHLREKVEVDGNGLFQISTDLDQLKLAVVERHRGTGLAGLGIVKGLGLKSGAVAATIAHDSHNIIAVGVNDADLLKAIETLADMNGGIAVVDNGQALAALPLPIAGLMSDRPYDEVSASLEQVNAALARIGFQGDYNPLLTLSFLALPVIPELKLTATGLFHVGTFTPISVSVED